VDHLLQHMRDIGRYDDTLIIIVSDHGEEFNEHGLMRHGSTLYEPQVSVPLLVKFPSSVNDPPVVSSNFQHVDVFPSILDLLQIEPPAELQGSAWGAGRDYTLTEVFVRNRKSAFLRRELCAVRRGQLKYIRSTTGEEEVYDLATDPQETRNLWGTRPEVEASFQETLTERNQKITQQILRGREDEELVERLRSLGYLQ
jgi:arylsulfatase A-like enzyme